MKTRIASKGYYISSIQVCADRETAYGENRSENNNGNARKENKMDKRSNKSGGCSMAHKVAKIEMGRPLGQKMDKSLVKWR